MPNGKVKSEAFLFHQDMFLFLWNIVDDPLQECWQRYVHVNLIQFDFYIIVCYCYCYYLFAGIGNLVLTHLSVVTILSVWKDQGAGLVHIYMDIFIVWEKTKDWMEGLIIIDTITNWSFLQGMERAGVSARRGQTSHRHFDIFDEKTFLLEMHNRTKKRCLEEWAKEMSFLSLKCICFAEKSTDLCTWESMSSDMEPPKFSHVYIKGSDEDKKSKQ